MMEEASRAWSLELSRTASNISLAANEMQKRFEKASIDYSAKGDNLIPDPIKLLRRISALESAIEKLRVECTDIVEQRNELVLSVTSLQLENVSRLQQLSILMERGPSLVDLQWESMEIAVREQHALHEGCGHILVPKFEEIDALHSSID